MTDERDLQELDVFPDDHEPEAPKRALTARDAAIVVTRIVTGIVGIAVAGGVIVAATLLPLPTVQAVAPSERINPVPTAQQLVCPGATLRLADDSGQGATAPSALGSPSITSFSSTGAVDEVWLDASDAGTGGSNEAPSVISTPPDEADPTAQILLSGAQSQTVDSGDFVGLAATDCGAVSGDSWLVGGATTIGRTTLLTLSNPTEVPATVDLELFGENGPIAAPSTSGIIVAPRGQRVLSLAGFQPDIVSPVVHVSSAGGQVVASLQQSTVRGLDAGGIDTISAVAAPATSTVIPGVLVTNRVPVQQLLSGGEGFADLTSTLRLLATGEADTTATVSVIPTDAEATGLSFTVDLRASRTTDVSLEELGAGSYTVRVDAETPVVAGMRVSNATGSATDFAWANSASELGERALVTIAEGPSPRLHLHNSTDEDAVVTIDRDGTATEQTVLAGASIVTTVEAGASYRLENVDGFYSAVTFAGTSALARYSVIPPGVGSAPIVVYP